MIEDTKKAHNANLTEKVEGSSNKLITSDYIIESYKLLEQGFKVYLLAQGTNTPHKGSRGHLDATDDVLKLAGMFKQYGASNIGISLKDTGLVVLDIDRHTPDKNGLRTLNNLGIKTNFDYGSFETTPRGGVHVFYRIPDGLDVSTLKRNIGAGLELLTDKVTVSPSFKNVDGKQVNYEHFGKDFMNASMMPDWLVKMASNVATSGNDKKRKPRYSIDQRIEMLLNGFGVGQRNNQIMSFAGWLLSIRDIDPNLVYELVQKVNSESDVPLPDKEVNAVFRSAYNREVKRASIGGL